MDWYKSAVFYEVYIRAFSDSNGDGHGDIPGLTNKLDYFVDLGVDCLWLLPMYPSPLVDDGYDIADYYNIHPDYGTLDDFKLFLNEAHARGLRVITDLVLNHTSNQHPWFLDSRSSKTSEYRDYYVWSSTDQKYKDTRIIFIDSQTSNWEFDPLTGEYYWHRFYPEQPDLNFDNPKVQEAMIDIMRYWLDIGMDGFRVDAVPYLFEREGTNCENLPETHAYVRHIRNVIEKEYPGRVLLAEANQWPKDVCDYFGDGDEFHMAFHFPLMPRVYLSLARANPKPIIQILSETPEIPECNQWCIFLRNHDELTLEMVTLEERDELWNYYAPSHRMRLNLGIRRRLAPLLDGDIRKIELVNSLLFTLPGAPILYYGDEIGMGDNIYLEDRNGVRTPMQWDASPGAGFSSAPLNEFYTHPIEDPTYGYQQINVFDQRNDPNSLWNTIRLMLLVRKIHPAFATGRLEFLDLGNPTLLGYFRKSEDETLLVIHNLSSEPQVITRKVELVQNDNIEDLLPPGFHFPTLRSFDGEIQIQPYGYHWLRIPG
jgi:maltose alpha-D-glucosyltransferase / alpha-amylase